ncbi:MAG: ATP-binding protein [Ferruginibacter sp.]
MYSETVQSIVIFVVCILVLLMLFGSFIVTIVYRYKRNQRVYSKQIDSLRTDQENDLLKGQLEMQEYTFSNISREIHDNVGQKLSLAKLLLNTRDFTDVNTAQLQAMDSIALISEAISDLGDISRSMSSEMILNDGLVKAIKFEISQLKKSGIYNPVFTFEGQEVPLDAKKELTIFRILQESFHNIIKHANASDIFVRLNYEEEKLILIIEDNGNGFQLEKKEYGTGLANIKTRTSTLGGKFAIVSDEKGTCLNLEIPFKSITDA